MDVLKMLNLALRFGMELWMLGIFGYWGFKTGSSTGMRWLLGIGAPLLAAVIWGIWMAPKASMRLQGGWFWLVELVLFGLAGWALYSTGAKNLTLWFGLAYVINRILMVVWKQ
jgi:hypothetical protein